VLVRALGLAALALVVVAIALGRSAPRTPLHLGEAVRFQALNMRCTPEQEAQPCFLDRQTGQVLRLEMPAGEILDYAACSPWRDEHGQFQAVGRWINRLDKRYFYLPQDFGLARFSLPDGKVLDRIQLEQIPVGEPCWVPGQASRILFPSGDGRLYRYDFSEPGTPPSLGQGRQPAQPQPVEWGIAPPGIGPVYVRDLTWPTEPALRGCLIVSLCYLERGREPGRDRPAMTGSELWWLRLSPDETVIEAAGRLTDPAARDRSSQEDRGFEERLPNVAATADGARMLVYLSRPCGQEEWDLSVASIAIEPATGVPAIRPGTSRRVGTGFVASTPTFSVDGRWIYGVRSHELGGVRLALRRFPTTPTLLAQAQSEVIPIPRRPDRTGGGAAALFGWADLVPFSPNRLVEVARWRHPGK
jgi:hypothetical protein